MRMHIIPRKPILIIITRFLNIYLRLIFKNLSPKRMNNYCVSLLSASVIHTTVRLQTRYLLFQWLFTKELFNDRLNIVTWISRHVCSIHNESRTGGERVSVDGGHATPRRFFHHLLVRQQSMMHPKTKTLAIRPNTFSII